MVFILCTMAGAGRRSHYRKHLTDHVLNDLPIPTSSQRIAQVRATRGGNQFEICVEEKEQLALLPTKFHKLVWVKRGDYVIVDKGEDILQELEGEYTGGVRFMIAHLLYKDQVKHLKNEGLWPVEFDQDNDENKNTEKFDKGPINEDIINDDTTRYGISYDYVEDDDDLFINTNHLLNLKAHDSASESEEE